MADFQFPKIKGFSQRTEEEKSLARKNDRNSHDSLKRLQKLSGNQVCADCTEKFPGWVALPHGVFICIDCAQLHRHLGRHISQVKAVNTGTYLFYEDEVEAMRVMGNAKANGYYLGAQDVPPKPSQHASRFEKEQYIRQKYEKKKWVSSVSSSFTEKKGPSSVDKKRTPSKLSSSPSKVNQTLSKKEELEKRRARRKTPSPTPQDDSDPWIVSFDEWAPQENPSFSSSFDVWTTSQSMLVPEQPKTAAPVLPAPAPVGLKNDPFLAWSSDQRNGFSHAHQAEEFTTRKNFIMSCFP